MVLLGRPERVRRREQHCEQHCQQQNERYRERDVDKGRALKNAKPAPSTSEPVTP
jgi:hypothetical protein